jgi:hypothetical protein
VFATLRALLRTIPGGSKSYSKKKTLQHWLRLRLGLRTSILQGLSDLGLRLYLYL